MASAAFTLNGSSSPLAVSAGATVTLALTSDVGVRQVTWEIIGGSDSTKTTPTITPSGFGASFTMTTPVTASLGVAWIVRCKVNGGVDDEGRVVSALTSTGIVGVLNGSGYLPFPVGETFERNSTHGIADDMNAQFGLLAGGGSLVSTSTTGTVAQLGSASTVLTTDGATPGGAWTLLVNANVDAAAAIAGTKISPNFGAQNVVTTGNLTADGVVSVGAGGSGSFTAAHAGTTVLTTAADGVTVSGGSAPKLVVDNGGSQATLKSIGTRTQFESTGQLWVITGGVSRFEINGSAHIAYMPDATAQFIVGNAAAAWTGYLGLGGTPGSSGTNGTGLRAGTGDVRLPGGVEINVRNGGDSGNVAVINHDTSTNALSFGDVNYGAILQGSTAYLKHNVTTVLTTHSAGVSLGTGTMPGTGTVRTAHGSSYYARSNGGSDVHVLSFGSVATDDLYVGDSSYDTVIRGATVAIQHGGSTVLSTASASTIDITADQLRWVQGATSPNITQVAAAASTSGRNLEIQAQGSVTAGFSGGHLVLRAGGAPAAADFGNIALGAAPPSWGSMAGGIHVYNRSAAPTSSSSVGFLLWSESGVPAERTAAGNVTHWSMVSAATASAGSATLPSNPIEFATITYNGNTRKIPLYAS